MQFGQTRRSLTVQEKLTSLGVRGYALKERERVAHAVRGVRGEVRRRQQGIHGYNLLKQGRHDA